MTIAEKIEKLRIALPNIDFDTGLATCCGDEDFLMELFQDYVELPIKEELQTYYEKGDCKQYCVRVHGFKSSSYSIGAKTLGDMAYEIEMLTKEALSEEVMVLQQRMFEEYDRICSVYAELIN